MPKRCFVISPIGDEGSEVRRHADDVFECIVQPALAGMGIEAIRADHMKEPGKITDQMIDAILQYDVCVAVLTGRNPNVYYEMALAQAAARPLVLLIQKGESIPFDVHDYRCIQYDLEPTSVFRRTWVSAVAHAVQQVLAPDAPLGLPNRGSIMRAAERHRYWLNSTSKEFGEAPRFLDVVSQTEERLDLMGISLQAWRDRPSSQCLKDVAATGCRVRILIMHEDHPALASVINEELPIQRLEGIRTQIRDMHHHFSQMAKSHPTLEVRKIVHGLVHNQLTLTDRKVLLLQYFFSRIGSDSPLLEYPAGSPLYDVVSEEFNLLWERNAPAAISAVPIAQPGGEPSGTQLDGAAAN